MQGVRRYATESPSSGRLTRWATYGGSAFAASFVAYYIANVTGLVETKRDDPDLVKLRAVASGEYKFPNKTFKGGDQGWVDLKLESVEEINHNTKKFRFALPDENDVSGLQVACMSMIRAFKDGVTFADGSIAALLTKYKGPEMEKVRSSITNQAHKTHIIQASDSTIHPNQR